MPKGFFHPETDSQNSSTPFHTHTKLFGISIKGEKIMREEKEEKQKMTVLKKRPHK